MSHFQLFVYVCAGVITILGAVKIVTGAIMQKESSEMKKGCREKMKEQTDKFEKIERCFREIENGTRSSNDRILVLETRFAEIISRMTRVENTVDKNAEMTRLIYEHMARQDAINGMNGKNGNGVKQD
jgi:hypothetical protein